MEEVREEEEQMEEGREEVGDSRRACLTAALTVLPKLRGPSGYITSKFSPHHTGEGEVRVEEVREEEEQV